MNDGRKKRCGNFTELTCPEETKLFSHEFLLLLRGILVLLLLLCNYQITKVMYS